MHHNTFKRLLACGIAAATVAGSSITVMAAEPQWGVMPDGFTFSTESTGHTVAVGGNSGSTSSSAGSTANANNSSSAPTESAQIDLTAYAAEIFRLANFEREKVGFAPLERCAEMDVVAAIRAREMAQVYGHTRPNGEKYTTLVKEHGIRYSAIGEIGAKAWTSKGTAAVIQKWLDSEEHRGILLKGTYQSAGIGVYQDGNIIYCAMISYN